MAIRCTVVEIAFTLSFMRNEHKLCSVSFSVTNDLNTTHQMQHLLQ